MILTGQDILDRIDAYDWILTRTLVDILARSGTSSSQKKGFMPAPSSYEISDGLGPAPSEIEFSDEDEGLMPNVQESEFGEGDEETEEKIKFYIKNLQRDSIITTGFDSRIAEDIFLANRIQQVSGVDELVKYAKKGDIKKLKFQNGKAVLEPDIDGENVYYVVSSEIMQDFPEQFSLFVDAKSTTGRVAGMCTDASKQAIASGNGGHIITTVRPYAFPLEVEAGKTSLVQAVIRYRDSEYMSKREVVEKGLVQLFDNDSAADLPINSRFGERGLLMTYSTKKAFRAKPIKEIPCPINMDAIKEYDWQDFFDFIEGNEEFLFGSKRFYLLGTREGIALKNVCGILSREVYETTGLWGQFAGLFHPGWEGPITTECYAVPGIQIRSGDVAGYVNLDLLEGEYDPSKNGYTGEYQHQEVPRLPKMFKPFRA